MSAAPAVSNPAVDKSLPVTEGDVRDRILMSAGLLRGVEPCAAPAVGNKVALSDFHTGQTVFVEGDPGDRVYVIRSGRVKISRRGPGGRDYLLAIMGPSDIFGELEFFDPGPRTRTATAITEVVAVWLDRAMLRAWLAHRPAVAEQLLQVLVRRLRYTYDEVVQLTCTDVAGRVARQLLLLGWRFGTREGEALRVAHGLTQGEMAQLVKAERASVREALHGFVARGWILGPKRADRRPRALARRANATAGRASTRVGAGVRIA